MNMVWSIVVFFGVLIPTAGNACHATVQENVQRAVIAYVTEQVLRATTDSVLVEIRTMPPLPKSLAENVTWQMAKDPMTASRGTCSLPVEFLLNNRIVYRMQVSLRIRTFGTVMTVVRQVERHSLLTEADILRDYRETTALPESRIQHIGGLEGVWTKRILCTGTVLTRAVLEPVPLVAIDEPVTMIVRMGKVLVSMKAIAKDAGGAGALITVQKPGSHERLHARVIDKQTVELAVN
jgi:flagella basal body P-ring formation protein FlgA